MVTANDDDYSGNQKKTTIITFSQTHLNIFFWGGGGDKLCPVAKQYKNIKIRAIDFYPARVVTKHLVTEKLFPIS